MLFELLNGVLNFLNNGKGLLKKKKKNFANLNISRIIFNITSLIFLFIGRNFYIKSLIGCDGEEFKCILNSNMKYILDDIYYCTHSAFYFLCFLLIFHLKLCSFYLLFFFILIILELIKKDTGDSFLHHGILNISALFALLFLGEIFILIIILNFRKFHFKNRGWKFNYLSISKG